MDKISEPDQRFVAARIRRAALDAGIGPDDSLAPLIDALADVPAAVARSNAPLLAQFEALAALIKEARRPLTLTEMRDISRQIEVRLARRWVEMNRWGVGIGVALCLALAAVSGAGCYWWGVSRQGTVAVTNCEPVAVQAGEAARCLFWVRLPPQSQQNQR